MTNVVFLIDVVSLFKKMSLEMSLCETYRERDIGVLPFVYKSCLRQPIFNKR